MIEVKAENGKIYEFAQAETWTVTDQGLLSVRSGADIVAAFAPGEWSNVRLIKK